MKVLEAIAAAIAAEGIDHLFAVMGDANQDIIVELCEKHGLKFIHGHHEGSAVGMADGYARFSSKSASLAPRKALAIPTQRLPWFVPGCIDRQC